MNQSNNISVLSDFLPENLAEKVVVKKAYIAKAGFVRIKFKEDFQKTVIAKLVAKKERAFDEYI
jgi:hypothetical protein